MTQLARRVNRAVNPFEGEWAELHESTLEALLSQYAHRGPQYEMLAAMASGLFVQTRRMEAMHANADPGKVHPEMMRAYVDAIDILRKVIDQGQRYSEAKRQEVIRVETNAAVLECLRITEGLVDPQTFLRIVSAVKGALER